MNDNNEVAVDSQQLAQVNEDVNEQLASPE